MDNERRLACVLVSPELVVSLAAGQVLTVDRNDVPMGVRVLRVTHESRGCQHAEPCVGYFKVLMSHESFASVPVGDEIPVLRGPIYTTVNQDKGD